MRAATWLWIGGTWIGCAAPLDTPVPDQGRQSVTPECIDLDGDGFGDGPLCQGPDCDDSDPTVVPGAEERCDGRDNDCDGVVDEDTPSAACALTQGVCAGATAACVGGVYAPCVGPEAPDPGAPPIPGDPIPGLGPSPGRYGVDYEATESRCDGLDNDCDGQVDEGCDCVAGEREVCGEVRGACRPGMRACDAGAWGACVGQTLPEPERCDGLDNDCDGVTDEEIEPPSCPLLEGVCAGAAPRCGGEAGFLACDAATYGPNYALAETEARCDGLDNDCDGATDEACPCQAGETRSCGLDVGACRPGTATCENGRFAECRGARAPSEEICNGVDDDCDGGTDESVMRPACPLAVGVCAGALAPCGGADGFLPCDFAVYRAQSPAFVAVETAAHCDGLDNDCDGTVDEDCDCVDGTTQPCGLATGTCTAGEQVCVGGRLGACDGVAPVAETCGDGLDNDCDGRADEGCPPPRVRINEVFYDSVGADAPNVFIELIGPPGTALDGWRLEGVNGANGMVYQPMPLSGRIAADGWYLVAHTQATAALAARADLLSANADLQNGPDSLRLRQGEVVVDAVAYGTFDPDETPAGEGAPVVGGAPGTSIARRVDGADTDDNAADFEVRAVPTPRGSPLVEASPP